MSPVRSRSEAAFMRENVASLDPGGPLWTTNIPMTWRHGYEAAVREIAEQARAMIEAADVQPADLWHFIHDLSLGDYPVIPNKVEP